MPRSPGFTNDRSDAAERALKAHADSDFAPDADTLRELLRDLMHWAKHHNVEFYGRLDRARENFEFDLNEEDSW